VLDADDVGAYANTNPAGYQNVSQVVAYANVISVNGASGVVVLDADDVGAYSNLNPAGYQNVTQVVSYANVVSVNGKNGVVDLSLDDLTNVNVTSPTNGYVLTYLSTSNTWNAVQSQGGGSAIDLGNIILNAQVFS
jgi:hypothetical protein